MNLVKPLVENKEVTYDDITYKAEFYKTAVNISGVIDEPHPNWEENPATPYATGDYVIIPELKKIYRSAMNDNDTYPLASPDKWVDYGIVNSYKMFAADQFLGSQTSGSDMVLEFDFSQCDTIAAVNIEFISANIELINDDTSEIVFSQTIHGSDIGCLTYGEYFYTKAKIRKRIVMTDLEWLPNSTLRITFAGDATIGTVVYGNQEEMGVTLVGSRLRFEDRSKIQVDEISGYRNVIRYGSVRILDCSVMFDTDEFNTLSQNAEDILSKNILFIPTDKDKFSESITIGYIENFEVPMENATKTETNTTIIGVAK